MTFRYVWVPPYEQNDRRRTISMAWFSMVAFWTTLRAPERVIYGSSPHLFGAFAAFLAAKARRRPFVFEVRDLWPEHLAGVDPSIEATKLYRFVGVLANTLYRRSDLVVLFAESSRATVLARGARDDRIAVVSGVDLTAEAPELVERDGDECRFVYVGSMAPMYGLESVVRAWATMKSSPECTSLTFIGDGPERPHLEAIVRELGLSNVRILGAVPKESVAALLTTFDVGVLSFLPGEQFTRGISPQKMFDYMAANLPIASNVHGEVEATIASANAGLTSATRDSEGMRDLLDTLVEMGAHGRSKMDGGRAYLEANGNRRKMSDALVDQIEAIVGA